MFSAAVNSDLFLDCLKANSKLLIELTDDAIQDDLRCATKVAVKYGFQNWSIFQKCNPTNPRHVELPDPYKLRCYSNFFSNWLSVGS